MRGVFDLLCSQVLSRNLSIVVPVLFMALILIGATIPSDTELEENVLHFLLLPPTLQNLLHIPVYGLLAFLWRWSLAVYMRAKPAMVLAFSVTVFFGVFQELVQSLSPGRFASLSDVVFNTVGAGLGLWFFQCVRNRT